jgi:hypothetical protein
MAAQMKAIVSRTACTGEPPTCCQPLTDAEWTARGRRWQDAYERHLAAQPKACPECGAADPIPTYLAPDEWECSDTRCLATFPWRTTDGD